MQINILHLAGLTRCYGVECQLLNHLAFSKECANEIKHYVCALKISEPIKKELQDLKIPFTVNRLWPWKVLGFSKFIKKHNIHILHIHNQLRFPLRSRILPKLAGVPIIIEHEHGMVWNTFSTGLIKLTNKLVNMNISNSNATKIMLKEKCGIDAKVIYNGIKKSSDNNIINNTLKRNFKISENKKIVGFIGRLNTPKGVESFIKCIPLVIKSIPETHFVIVGDGPLMNELKILSKKIEIEKNISFAGYQTDARSFMKMMDIVVVPSIREPFGNVVIEAAFEKKPVIASNVDGMAETIINGETGFLVACTVPIKKRKKGASRLPLSVVDGTTKKLRPPKLPNTEMLAEKIVKCIKDEKLSVALGNQAYLRANNLFSLERYRNDLDNLYRELINMK